MLAREAKGVTDRCCDLLEHFFVVVVFDSDYNRTMSFDCLSSSSCSILSLVYTLSRYMYFTLFTAITTPTTTTKNAQCRTKNEEEEIEKVETTR